MVQGQVFLKGGGGRRGWHFSDLIFSRFIIFTFRNYFSVSKGHFKLSKNKPENIL